MFGTSNWGKTIEELREDAERAEWRAERAELLARERASEQEEREELLRRIADAESRERAAGMMRSGTISEGL